MAVKLSYLLIVCLLIILFPLNAASHVENKRPLSEVEKRFANREKMILVYFVSVDISVGSHDYMSARTKLEKLDFLFEGLSKDLDEIEKSVKKKEVSPYVKRAEKLYAQLEQTRSDVALIAINPRGPVKFTFDTLYEQNSRFKRNGAKSETLTSNMNIMFPVEQGSVVFSDTFNRWSNIGSKPQNHNLKIAINKEIKDDLSSNSYFRFSPYRDTKNTVSYTDDIGGGVDLRIKRFGNMEITVRDDYNKKHFRRNKGSNYYANQFAVSLKNPIGRNQLRFSSDANQTNANRDYGVRMGFAHRVSEVLTIDYSNSIQTKKFINSTNQNFLKNNMSIVVTRAFGAGKRLACRGSYLTDRRSNFTADSEKITRISGSWFDRLTGAFSYNFDTGYLIRDVNTNTRDYERVTLGAGTSFRFARVHLVSLKPKQVFARYKRPASSYQKQVLNLSWEMRLGVRQRIKLAHNYLHHIQIHDTAHNYDKHNADISWNYAPVSRLTVCLRGGAEQYKPKRSDAMNSMYNALTGSGHCTWAIVDQWEIESSVRYWDRTTKKNNTGDAGNVITSARLRFHF